MKKFLLIIVMLSVCMALSSTAFAATETTSFDVSVTAVPACSVVATGITFPDYSGFGLGATGDVTVTCNSGVPYNIALDAGLNYDGSFYRRLTDGTNFLNYSLLQPDIATNWGDSDYANTYPDGTSLADVGDGTAQAHLVYGNLFPGGSVPPGVYSDTVTVTVHY